MPGLVPGIHAFAKKEDVDGRDEPGHDAAGRFASMLSQLSIRDIVLIDRLDIDFAGRLAVLTGETGAGKSILLDAFALALGARGVQASTPGEIARELRRAIDEPAVTVIHVPITGGNP